MQPIFQVDAFTKERFCGNPAGVCILSQVESESWMQSVASEMNVAETSFLLPAAEGYSLRWFTPLLEVDLCGHATLAAAHILWETGLEDTGTDIVFNTRSGLLTASNCGDRIRLDFPALPASEVTFNSEIISALEICEDEITYFGRNKFDFLIQVTSEQRVKSLKPRMAELALVDCRGVIVSSISTNDDYDFVSRFFAPRAGVPEDPVTGSAHCCLAPHWNAITGKTSMVGRQLSARGGVVYVSLESDRVFLEGHSITVLSGHLV